MLPEPEVVLPEPEVMLPEPVVVLPDHERTLADHEISAPSQVLSPPRAVPALTFLIPTPDDDQDRGCESVGHYSSSVRTASVRSSMSNGFSSSRFAPAR